MKNREMYLEAMSEGGQIFDKIRQNKTKYDWQEKSK